LAVQVVADGGDVTRLRLAEQIAETEAGAQEKASESAKEKVKASAARVKGARAALEVRRAQYAGARLRAAEAIRIRESLSRPPLRLPAGDAIEGTIAFAGFQHADAIEAGLKASRQILRLLRTAQIPEHLWPRPDTTLGDPQIARTPWSFSLDKQVQGFTEVFGRHGSSLTPAKKIPLDLTKPQRDALTTPEGLKLILRPGVKEIVGDDRIQQNIEPEAATSGRIIAILFAGTVNTDDETSAEMVDQHYSPRAEYQGDRWVSEKELHLIDVQRVRASRVFVVDPKVADLVDFVVDNGQLNEQAGNFNFNGVPGTPTSGTTVVRLKPINPRPIASLKLTILHNFFVPEA
jgi:hypothetical protein